MGGRARRVGGKQNFCFSVKTFGSASCTLAGSVGDHLFSCPSLKARSVTLNGPDGVFFSCSIARGIQPGIAQHVSHASVRRRCKFMEPVTHRDSASFTYTNYYGKVDCGVVAGSPCSRPAHKDKHRDLNVMQVESKAGKNHDNNAGSIHSDSA
jgi:hypothetical protein